MRKKDQDFNVGYVLACANLVNLHGEVTLATDVLCELGITWADVIAMGLSEYDMDALQQIRDHETPKRRAFRDAKETTHAD